MDEVLPLAGKRIVVTRSAVTARTLAEALEALGAHPLECPTIELAPPDDFGPLDRAIGALERYDWLIFTSPAGVDSFVARMRVLSRDMSECAAARIAAIGPATAQRWRRDGPGEVEVPGEFRAEAIAAMLGEERIRGARFLIPRAQTAREALVDLLRRMGAAQVDVVAAYKTVMPANHDLTEIKRSVAAREIDLISFTSPSTVNNFCALVELQPGLPAAVIGPITAQAARERGFVIEAIASRYTIAGLIEAIVRRLGAPATSCARS